MSGKVQLRPPDGPWRSTQTGHRITRDADGGVPWQTRTRPWTAPAEIVGRLNATGRLGRAGDITFTVTAVIATLWTAQQGWWAFATGCALVAGINAWHATAPRNRS